MIKTGRKETIIQIGILEDNHCVGCERVKTFKTKDYAIECVTKCEIGKQIHELGKTLGATGKVHKKEPKKHVTKEQYLELKSQGMREIDIMKELRIANRTLYKFKHEWGLMK